MRKKLLLYGDSPVATTGLGQLHRILLDQIHKTDKYDIEVVGLNHLVPYYDREKYPYKIYPTQMTSDPRFGRAFTMGLIKANRYDVVILSHDIQNCIPFYDVLAESQRIHNTTVIGYFCVDSMELNRPSAEMMNYPDIVLTYSQYTADLMKSRLGKKSKAQALWLPVDTEILKPDKEGRDDFRLELFGWDKKHFIITNVNRHIFRKDLGRTILAFAQINKKYPRTRLYLNAVREDHAGDITKLIENYGLTDDLVKISPFPSPAQGFKEEIMNKLYNASDLIVSSSRGEGYGYSTIEAMATKTPFIGPRNTSFVELVGSEEERGYLADCDSWAFDYEAGGGRRELCSVESLVEKIGKVYTDYHTAEEKADRALEFVQSNMSKEVFFKKFLDLTKI